MKELGITKGEWEISPDNNWECCILMGDQEDHYINFENRDVDGWDEMHANAELCCDAGNTAQKCGLLPSELLRQRDELREKYSKLLEAISEFLKSVKTDNTELKKSIAEMRINMAAEIAAIKKHREIMEYEEYLKSRDSHAQE